MRAFLTVKVPNVWQETQCVLFAQVRRPLRVREGDNFRICGLKMERRRRAAGLTPTKVLYTKAHNGELTDPGNVEADKEAEMGRKMHPKLPKLQQLLHAPGYFLAYKSAAFTGQGIKKLFLQIKEEEALRTACGRHAFIALPFIDKKLSVKLFQRPEFKRSRSQRLRALQVNATETVSRMVRPSTEAVRCDRCGDIIKNDRIKNGKKRDFVRHLYYCKEAGQIQRLIRACTAAVQKDHGITVECTDSFQIDMSKAPPIKKGIVHIDMIRGLFFKDFKQTVAKLVQKDAEQGNRSQQVSLKVDELMKDISEDISEIVRISYAHLTEPFRLWKSKHLPMEFQTQTLKKSQLKQMRTALPQHDRQAPTPWPNRMTYSRSERKTIAVTLMTAAAAAVETWSLTQGTRPFTKRWLCKQGRVVMRTMPEPTMITKTAVVNQAMRTKAAVNNDRA